MSIASFSIEPSLIIIPQCLPLIHPAHSIHWIWHRSCIIPRSLTIQRFAFPHFYFGVVFFFVPILNSCFVIFHFHVCFYSHMHSLKWHLYFATRSSSISLTLAISWFVLTLSPYTVDNMKKKCFINICDAAKSSAIPISQYKNAFSLIDTHCTAPKYNQCENKQQTALKTYACMKKMIQNLQAHVLRAWNLATAPHKYRIFLKCVRCNGF